MPPFKLMPELKSRDTNPRSLQNRIVGTMKIKAAYTEFAKTANLAGSGKATSYIRALDLLSEMIQAEPMGFSDCEDIWSPPSVERLNELYQFVRNEKKKGKASRWSIPDLPQSYLQNGYCSAALRDYQSFLVEHQHEESLFQSFQEHDGPENDVIGKLDRELEIPQFLLEELVETEGKEAIRLVKARSNQRVFRRTVQSVYEQACCITGIEISEVNRASHIIPWAKKKETRMDPRNGLYLSATYDAAFDRNLWSLDEDYRIILSRDLKEHYTSESTQTYFLAKEGQKIRLPMSFVPKQEYLEAHRSNGNYS